MPRAMSFFHTQRQIKDRTKTVTRRRGWSHLKPGDLFYAIEKGQGLKKGEKVRRLALLRCVSNRAELLGWISVSDCAAEGFPELKPAEFVAMFVRNMGGDSSQEVRRIEFEYVEVTAETAMSSPSLRKVTRRRPRPSGQSRPTAASGQVLGRQSQRRLRRGTKA